MYLRKGINDGMEIGVPLAAGALWGAMGYGVWGMGYGVLQELHG